MDQTTYERWWQLHLQVAKGEELDAAEQDIYAAGLLDLNAEEEKTPWENSNLTMLRRLRTEVESLETTHAQLQAKSRRLDRQIWTLEGAYMVLTGRELSANTLSYLTSLLAVLKKTEHNGSQKRDEETLWKKRICLIPRVSFVQPLAETLKRP